MEATLTDHDESMERLAQTGDDDIRQRAVDKITDAAEEASEKVEADARAAAAALTGEVQVLRQDITVLQKIDSFKTKVYVIGVVAAIFEVGAFLGLWMVSGRMEGDTNAIRTDLEVHRIRNEASHDCLAEKMTKIPSPEERATGSEATIREFVHEFLGCVAETAPTIVPPGAPDIRVTTKSERDR